MDTSRPHQYHALIKHTLREQTKKQSHPISLHAQRTNISTDPQVPVRAKVNARSSSLLIGTHTGTTCLRQLFGGSDFQTSTYL